MSLALTLLGACGPPATLPGSASDVAQGATVVRFVATGDVGKGNETQRQVAEAMAAVCAERGCDLGLLLGDNLYDRGMTRAQDPRMDRIVGEVYGPVGVPFYMVHGNHDYAHGRNHQHAAWARDWAARTDGFEHPSPYYRFEAGPAAFYGLDTTRAFWYSAAPQTAWLKAQLPAETRRWKVVFGHHTFRSNGDHGNAGAYEGWSGVPWMSGAGLASLFEQGLCGEADLYLSGHDHSLQWLEHCGVQLVVSGAGAAPRTLGDRGNEPLFATDKAGFFWIELGDQMKVVGFDHTGEVLVEAQRDF